MVGGRPHKTRPQNLTGATKGARAYGLFASVPSKRPRHWRLPTRAHSALSSQPRDDHRADARAGGDERGAAGDGVNEFAAGAALQTKVHPGRIEGLTERDLPGGDALKGGDLMAQRGRLRAPKRKVSAEIHRPRLHHCR